MKAVPPDLQGVLFDLDGTLIDSAPDLYAALETYCAEAGVAPPSYAAVREVISRGARAILRCAFDEDDAALLRRMPRYLAIYQAALATHTRPFDGIAPLLDAIEARGWRWGIVTNKPGFLTDELVRQLGWDARAGAVVSGDTLAVKKPDPAPLRLACAQARIDPAHAVFVGDDARDVQAGRAAGLYTVAVRWGYLDGGEPHDWGADAVLDHPRQLAELLALQVVA